MFEEEEDWDADMSSVPTTSKMTYQKSQNEDCSSQSSSDPFKRTPIGRGRGKFNSFDSGFGAHQDQNEKCGGGHVSRDCSASNGGGDANGYNSYKPYNNYGNDRGSTDFRSNKPRNYNSYSNGIDDYKTSNFARNGNSYGGGGGGGGGFSSNKPQSTKSFTSGEEGHVSGNFPPGDGNSGYRGNNSNSSRGYGNGSGENGYSPRRYGGGGGYQKKSYDSDRGGDSFTDGSFSGGYEKKGHGNVRGGGKRGGYGSRDAGRGGGGGGYNNRDGGQGGGYSNRNSGQGGGYGSRDNGQSDGYVSRDSVQNGGYGSRDSVQGGAYGGRSGGYKRQNDFQSSGLGNDNSTDNFSSGGFGSSGGGYKHQGNNGGYKHDTFGSSDNTGGGDFGSGGGYKSSGESRNCFKCNEPGHFARDCPKSERKGNEEPKKENYIPPPPPEDEAEMFDSMQRGINFSKYDAIPVEVSGENPPKPIGTFVEANLTETIAKNVARAKYEKPTPVQKYSIPIIGAGRDLMACAQTGSGKTAAFLLPVLTSMIRSGIQSSTFDRQAPQAIVVGPTRELVNQIFLEARKFARGSICRPCVAYGGTSVGHQIADINRGCNILIATPGRLIDFVSSGRIGLDHVQFIILDEADRMLDMGFEGEIRKLVAATGMPPKTDRQTLMFSATFPDEIQKLAHDFLKEDFIFLTVGRVGGACSDVTQSIIQVDQGEKRVKLLELLSDVSETRSRTLVFVETKRSADFLACSLSQAGYPTTSIHGDRLQREREEALRDFKKGDCPILIATSVAARGLDISKVEHVINYDLPKDIDEYVHRIGRTGRCGNLGRATSFFDQSKNSEIARCLVRTLADSMQEVPSWLHACADNAVDTFFNSNTDRSSRFGGRDTRTRGRGRGGGFGTTRQQVSTSRSTGDYDYNDGGGFGSTPTVSNSNNGVGFGGDFAEDESWD